MRDRLIELIEKCFEQESKERLVITPEYTADHLIANGVIVPPVNIGDDVWVIEKTDYILSPRAIYKGFVGYFDIRTYGRFMMIRLETDVEWQIHAYPLECFGKTVFLTREEAERALKGGAE